MWKKFGGVGQSILTTKITQIGTGIVPMQTSFMVNCNPCHPNHNYNVANNHIQWAINRFADVYSGLIKSYKSIGEVVKYIRIKFNHISNKMFNSDILCCAEFCVYIAFQHIKIHPSQNAGLHGVKDT